MLFGKHLGTQKEQEKRSWFSSSVSWGLKEETRCGTMANLAHGMDRFNEQGGQGSAKWLKILFMEGRTTLQVVWGHQTHTARCQVCQHQVPLPPSNTDRADNWQKGYSEQLCFTDTHTHLTWTQHRLGNLLSLYALLNTLFWFYFLGRTSNKWRGFGNFWARRRPAAGRGCVTQVRLLLLHWSPYFANNWFRKWCSSPLKEMTKTSHVQTRQCWTFTENSCTEKGVYEGIHTAWAGHGT